jgi:DNA-binding NtrC family response regulator
VATNQILDDMVADRRFRKDLFYRLNVIPLHVPPLRERREDIIPIAKHLLNQMAEEASLPEISLHRDAEEALCHYDWPGNIRELTNVLERVLSALEGDTIRRNDLPFYLLRSELKPVKTGPAGLRDMQHRAEKETIMHALKAARSNKARAAKLLGIHRTHLYKKMKKHGLSVISTLGDESA